MKREQGTIRWSQAWKKGSVLAAILVAGSPLFSLGSQELGGDEAEQFEAEVLVQEAALAVDFAGAVSPRELAMIEPDDVVVLENGERRAVTRIEPIARLPVPTEPPVFEWATACAWNLVIYVDTVLSDPATILEGTLALGQQAEALAELGCVGIVSADPSPVVLVASSRSPEYIAKTLVDLARAVRTERDRDPVQVKRPPGAGGRDISKVASQWDRLLGFVATHRSAGPKALFLISDGFVLSTTDLEILSGRERPSEGRDGDRLPADVVIDTAQTLSSYGWLTIAMPHVPGTGEPLERPVDRFDSWRDLAEDRIRAGERRSVINFFGTTRAGRQTSGLDDRLYEAYLLPTLAPLRALAQATSGEVVWSQRQLGEVLETLRRRRLLWYQTPEPHDGRVRRLQVHLSETGEYLEAPWWKRSSTPDLVAESRLRQVLAGEVSGASLEVHAEVVPSGRETRADAELRVRVSPVVFGERASIGHVRVSVGFIGPAAGGSFQHRTDYDAPPLGGVWQYRMPLQIPDGVTGLAVAVEDLSLEEWGAMVVDLQGDARAGGGAP